MDFPNGAAIGEAQTLVGNGDARAGRLSGKHQGRPASGV
jgi:hypothetical protein